jgi:hypothetical protein
MIQLETIKIFHIVQHVFLVAHHDPACLKAANGVHGHSVASDSDDAGVDFFFFSLFFKNHDSET